VTAEIHCLEIYGLNEKGIGLLRKNIPVFGYGSMQAANRPKVTCYSAMVYGATE